MTNDMKLSLALIGLAGASGILMANALLSVEPFMNVGAVAAMFIIVIYLLKFTIPSMQKHHLATLKEMKDLCKEKTSCDSD